MRPNWPPTLTVVGSINLDITATATDSLRPVKPLAEAFSANNPAGRAPTRLLLRPGSPDTPAWWGGP